MPQDHEAVGCHWDANSEVWTALARAGYDTYRDGLNTPAFLEMLPDVEGLSGLDVGCGEGHNTRLVAGRGARMVGIDISENFVRHAAEAEEADPLGIRYGRANAAELPFGDAGFDFAVAFMSLMDMPQVEGVLAEIFRVVRPGGFLQFSIEHPCFTTPTARPSETSTGGHMRARWAVTSGRGKGRRRSGSSARSLPRFARGSGPSASPASRGP